MDIVSWNKHVDRELQWISRSFYRESEEEQRKLAERVVSKKFGPPTGYRLEVTIKKIEPDRMPLSVEIQRI